MDNVAPNLIGSVMQSILKELPYPTTLQQQCIRRIRAEQKVTRERAAILKAYINRLNRQKNIKEVSVALDRTNENTGYLLGRLFAAFEKVQQESADTEFTGQVLWSGFYKSCNGFHSVDALESQSHEQTKV